jgi:hypothetical protein
MRRAPGTVRRIWIGLNPFPQPSSGQDAWAHYAEQMVLGEGFSAICRLHRGIRLHTGEWTLPGA